MDKPAIETPSSPYWKFKTIDSNTFKMLVNQEIWFSHPSKFNDPFDTNLDIRKVVKKIEEKLNYASLLYQEIERFLPTYNKDLQSRFVFSTNRGAPVFQPFKEVLMWSHYANEHTGICLGLSMNSVKERLMERSLKSRAKTGYSIFEGQSFLDHTTDLPVAYDTKFLEENTIPYVDACVGGSSLNRIEKLFETIFVKAKNWEYEQEHRFILFDKEYEGKPGVLVPFDGKYLENIIFGLNTPPEDQKTITKIVKDKGWDAKLWKAKEGEELFDLDFDRV